MEHEYLSVRRDRLLAGAKMLPAERRAIFFATIFMGPDETSADASAASTIDDESDSYSFPLSVDQARELKEKIDEATWAVIKAAVSNAKDDVGTIEWSEIKRLTGVSNWAQFAQGRMSGLHRSLRKIVGVPKSAVLLWEGEGWVEDGKGDFLTGTVVVDGPAVRVLRAVCGFRDSKD